MQVARNLKALMIKSRDKALTSAALAAATLASGLASQQALAITKTDLTTDISNGKKVEDVATNVDNTVQVGATLFISIVSVSGFVIVAFSIYQLYKASKDEREKPTSAVVGLLVGGLMAAVGPVMWIVRNTLVG